MAGAGVNGPARKPELEVVREGNLAHRPIREEFKLPPIAPDEPDWSTYFPPARGVTAESNRVCRARAKEVWRFWVGQLAPRGVLAQVDFHVLADAAVCVARIERLEHDISLEGFTVPGRQGGMVSNPKVSMAQGYRTQMYRYISQLPISPATRSRMPPTKSAEDATSPFD